jgi:hypothetical protein
MPGDFLPAREYHALRERQRVAAVKLNEEQTCDHELEQCVIAYSAFRLDGGFMTWESFRRDWYQRKQEARDGR